MVSALDNLSGTATLLTRLPCELETDKDMVNIIPDFSHYSSRDRVLGIIALYTNSNVWDHERSKFLAINYTAPCHGLYAPAIFDYFSTLLLLRIV